MDSVLSIGDGQFRFTLRRANGAAEEFSLDVLLLKLTCEECEQANGLKEDANGGMRPTAAFLNDLAGRLAGLGVVDCTASAAYQLWCASTQKMAELQKKTDETPNSLSGSASNPPPNPDESAVSNSPPPAESPTPNGSAY